MEENQSASKNGSTNSASSGQAGSQSFLAMSIVVAAILVAGALVYSAGRGEVRKEQANLSGGDAGTEVPADLADDDVILGDPNAPVTIVEFGDYQCPFCARFFSQTEPKLRDEYIKAGKVKMVYRDFPLDSIHPYARSAAEASECARDQEKYWVYHDALFERQEGIPGLDFVKLAGELGLNIQQFRQCYESKKYASEVEKDYQDGLAIGVNGTPTTYVNGQAIVGAQPYSVFRAAIDKALLEE